MKNLTLSALMALSVLLAACTPGQQFEIDFKEKPDVIIQTDTQPNTTVTPVKPPVTVPVK